MWIKRVGAISLLVMLFVGFTLTLPKVFDGESESKGSLKMYRQLKEAIEILDGYYLTDEIIVALDEDDSIQDYEQLLHARKIGEMRNGSIRMEIEDGKTFEDILELHRNNDELLAKVFPHRTYQLMHQGDESNQAPHFDVLNMSGAWQHSTGEGISVAVIDTGIDYYHEGFLGIVSERSYNAMTFEVGLEHVLDSDGHGTSVASVIKHRYDGLAHQGIAPDVELIVIKTSDYDTIYQSELDEAIHYAMQENVDVINMSLGAPAYFFFDEFMAQSIALLEAAIEQGIIIVAAAGNESSTSKVYPASHPKVLSVGATTFEGDELAQYSNYGRYVDVVAPGRIETLEVGGGTEVVQGTSISAPAVAGVVALYLSLNPEASFEEVYGMLISTSNDLNMVGRDLQFAYGQVDAEAFLTAEKGTMTFIDEYQDASKVKYSALDYPIVDLWRPVHQYLRYGGWSYDQEGNNEVSLYHDLLTQDTVFYKQWAAYEDETHRDLFLYKTHDVHVSVVSYHGDERTVNLPEYEKDLPIKVIAPYAFASLYDMHRITLSENLEVIETHGFFESSISQIEFAKDGNLTTIETEAFYFVHHLSDIVLPDSVEIVEDFGFFIITDLSYVSIGKNVKSIGDNAFVPFLTSLHNMGDFDWIDVHPDNAHFTSVDGVLYDKAMTTLVLYPTQRTKSEFILPDSITTVETTALDFQEHLEVLVLGKQVEKLPDELNLFNLKAIHVHPDNPFFSSHQGVLYDDTMTILLHYPVLASNFEMVIPPSVNYFHQRAFNTFGVFTNRSEVHTLMYLSEDLIARELDEEALLSRGIEPSDLLGIEEISRVLNNFNIVLKNIYMSEAMVTAVIDDFEDVWFNERGYELHAYDQLTIKPQTLKDKYHFDYEMNVDYDIRYQDEIIGEVLLKEIVELDQAFKNTTLNHITFTYLDQTETIELPLYPSITFDTRGGAYLEEIRYHESIATLSTLPQAKKVGYHFTGWYLDKDYEEAFDAETLSSRVTLYAHYEPLTYTIHYHYDDQTTLRHYDFDETIDYVVYVEDHVLVDWVDETGKSYFLHHMPNQDLELYPVFETIPDDPSYDDYRFTIASGYAIITDYIGNDAVINLPRYYQDDEGDIYYIKRMNTGVFLGNKTVEEVIFEDHYRDIGTRAFYRATNLREVHLPNQLEIIRPYAFNHAESLESIMIPKHVDSIGKSAFLDAVHLAKIEFASEARITHIDRLAFSYVSQTETLTLPDSIDFIGMNAFASMDNLKTIKLPSYLKTITQGLFFDTPIQSLKLPETLESIHPEAFAMTDLQSLVIPERVNHLPGLLFNRSSTITTLEIGASVTTMHTDALANMTGLAYISVDQDNSRFIVIDDMLLSIDQSKLLIYPSANPNRNLTVPKNIRHINAYAFSGAQHLESVTMSNEVQTIGRGVFREANKVSHIDLSNAITHIPQEAFMGARALRTLTIPEQVVSIGTSAFQESGIEHIILPDSVRRIDNNAFMMTENLESIVFPDGITIDYAVLYLSHASSVVFKGDLDFRTDRNVMGAIQPFGEMPNLEAIYIHEAFETSLINYMQFLESYNLDKIAVFDQLQLDESAQHINVDDDLNQSFVNLVNDQTVIYQVPFLNMIESKYAHNPLLIESGVNQFVIQNGETWMTIEITLEAPIIQIRYIDYQDRLLNQAYYVQGSVLSPPDLTTYYADETYVYHFIGWEANEGIAMENTAIRAIHSQYPFKELIELAGPKEVLLGSDEPYYNVIISPDFSDDWDWWYYHEIDFETPGIYEIEVTITDSASHMDLFTVVFEVRVIEDNEVLLTLLGSSDVFVEIGSDWADEGATCVYADGTLCATDKTTDVDLDQVGSYHVTYSYIDDDGNEHEVTRTVNVVDTTPPIVSLKPSLDTIQKGSAWHDGGVNVFDHSDYSIEIIGDVDVTDVGTYVIKYSVSDVYDNNTTVKRLVNVIEAEPSVEFQLHKSLTTIPVNTAFTDEGCTVIIDGRSSTCTVKENTVNQNIPGVYTITYSAIFQEVEYTYYRYIFVVGDHTLLSLDAVMQNRKEDELC